MNESQVSAAGADDNQIHMVVAAGDEYDANHQALEEKSNIGESG
jgi:hypothetical protein